MEDKVYSIITDLIRSDIDRQEAVDRILAVIADSEVSGNKFKKSVIGNKFNRVQYD